MTSAVDRLRAAAPRPPAGHEAFREKVRTAAYTVTDADVDALRAAGCSDDAIFELTVATAVAAGLERLDAGMQALAGR